jgi:probable phosphoglycerate mutase
MTSLYIIRHGEAHSNVEPWVVGGMKGCRGLTERGFAQARALANRLATGEIPIDVLYASTLPRTQQTAELVANALDRPIIWDDDLHELRPGEADGLTFEQARAAYPNLQGFLNDLYLPFSPGGESWASFQLRVSATLARIIATHPGQRIAIVAHGGVIEVSFLYMLGLGPQARSRNAFHVRNTAITHWKYSENHGRHEWELNCHNDYVHLRAEKL